MKLRILTPEELSLLYHTELTRAFPPAELKPLKSMEDLRRRGCYEPLGLFEGEALLGYALMWLEPGVPFALLDHLGTVEGRRNGGLGARTLSLLADYYASYRGIFGEAEGPHSPDPEEAALQRRRLGFYRRNGFRYGGYDCALFGVHYQALIRGRDDVTPEELLAAHRAIYQAHFPAAIYDSCIQLPLSEGEPIKPVQPWIAG